MPTEDRDAVILEREARLVKARKKLRKYRASQTGSISTDKSHRRSISRSSLVTPKSHARRQSASRHSRVLSNSRLSFQYPVPALMNANAPAAPLSSNSQIIQEQYAEAKVEVNTSSLAPEPSAPGKPSSGHGRRGSRHSRNISISNFRESLELYAPPRPTNPSVPSTPLPLSSLPNLSPELEPRRHTRRGSRHSRNISISNFRQSLEILSGQLVEEAPSSATVSSFSSTPRLNPALSRGEWQVDPSKVLEALKERGRREEEEDDPVQTRLAALDALEGRAVWRQDLDDGLVPSPRYPTSLSRTDGAKSPLPSSVSPMMSQRRGSSGTMVAAIGGTGALSLGALVEEEEEPENGDDSSFLTRSLKKSTGKRRPATLMMPSPVMKDVLAESSHAPSSSWSTSMRSLSLTTHVPLPRPSISPVEEEDSEGVTPVGPPSRPQNTSLFHSIAVDKANVQRPTPPAIPPHKPTLKSLSIGAAARPASPMSRRTLSNGSNTSTTSPVKRSTLGYHTTSISEEQRTGLLFTEESEGEEKTRDAHALKQQIQALEAEVSSLRREASYISLARTNEVNELKTRAVLESRGFRSKIGELERALAEAQATRKREAVILRQEMESAQNIINDLSDERDALLEDVDGWRQRCAGLQESLRKEHEDDMLANAQAKLIGEMRDRIYNLVEALEKERSNHADTRADLDHLLTQQQHSVVVDNHDEEAYIGGAPTSRHGLSIASDVSLFSGSSFSRSYSGNTTEDTSIMTDMEDSSNKTSYSLGSMFNLSTANLVGTIVGGKRDSREMTTSPGCAGVGNLDTLAEVEEEESHDEGHRAVDSTSTVSSGVMPDTPGRSHRRTGSFVRTWSFPQKGSISSFKSSSTEDDHIFFGINKEVSLPALPISASARPPFLTAEITVDEDVFAQHFGEHNEAQETKPNVQPRPTSRPIAPPPKPGFASPQKPPMMSPARSSASISRLPLQTPSSTRSSGLGRITSWIGWGANSTTTVPQAASVSASSRPSSTSSRISTASPVPASTAVCVPMGHTPIPTTWEAEYSPFNPMAQTKTRTRSIRHIQPSEQPIPQSSNLDILDFIPACCCNEQVVVV